jgi:hypothetical protein
MQKTNISVLAIVLIIAGSAAGFFAGTKYQQNQTLSAFQGRDGGMMGNTAGGNRTSGSTRMQQGFRPVAGEIIAQDDKTITVKLQDGSSKIVNIADSTTINKSSEGAKTDLTTGQKVSVFGTENTDGSVSATNVQLNPMIRMMDGSPTPEQK